MIKEIFFDMDGTLLNSSNSIINTMRSTLRELGYKEIATTNKNLEWIIGPPIETTIGKLINTTNGKEIIKFRDKFREIYKDNFNKHDSLYDGIIELLEELNTLDINLYIATSKHQHYLKDIAKNNNIDIYFKDIKGHDDNNVNSKGAVISHLLQKHKISPNNTIIVGDRKYDAKGAKENNLHGWIGVSWGYGSIDEIKQYNPLAIADNTNELLAKIKQLTDK